MSEADTYTRIRYEAPADHVVGIMLAREDTRNAQGKQMLYA